MLNNLLQSDAIKAGSKRAIQKSAEGTDHLKGNKVADKIRRVSKFSPQGNSDISEEEILREIYISRPKTENYC